MTLICAKNGGMFCLWLRSVHENSIGERKRQDYEHRRDPRPGKFQSMEIQGNQNETLDPMERRTDLCHVSPCNSAGTEFTIPR